MTYRVKEIFYTLQGEGTHAGRAGRVLPVQPAATCGPGGRRTAHARDLPVLRHRLRRHRRPGRRPFADAASSLADASSRAWPDARARAPYGRVHRRRAAAAARRRAVDALHEQGFDVAVETNGTRCPRPASTGSASAPRPARPLVLTAGDELKLVFPQDGGDPAQFEAPGLRVASVQPMDGPSDRRHTAAGSRVLPDAPALAAEPADPQVPGNPVTGTTRSSASSRFEAAHRLPNVPTGHKCARLHGHSYRVEVHVAGDRSTPSSGWVMDFADIKAAWQAA